MQFIAIECRVLTCLCQDDDSSRLSLEQSNLRLQIASQLRKKHLFSSLLSLSSNCHSMKIVIFLSLVNPMLWKWLSVFWEINHVYSHTKKEHHKQAFWKMQETHFLHLMVLFSRWFSIMFTVHYLRVMCGVINSILNNNDFKMMNS